MKTATKSNPGREAAAAPLRPLLADLVALSLQTNQAHWNVTGPQFQSLHELFDSLADEHRGWYDMTAERLRALGEPADARLGTLREFSGLDEMPAGLLDGARAVGLLLSGVEGTASRAREALGPLGEADPVTQDMVIGIVEGLEKQAWMLRSHRS